MLTSESLALRFAHADALWQLELDRIYGDAARAARLLAAGKGQLNSTLRTLWEARQEALRAYERPSVS